MEEGAVDSLLESAARDIDLLEESLCDLVVAFGGTAQVSHDFFVRHLSWASEQDNFAPKINSGLLRRFRKKFAKLDIPAPALIRLLLLHIKRGAALLNDCPQCLRSDPFTPSISQKDPVDAECDAEIPILKPLIDLTDLKWEPPVDVVEGRHAPKRATAMQMTSTSSQPDYKYTKIFCGWYVDAVLGLYDEVLKRVCSLDLFDCIRLRCFFVNLDNILTNNGIQHMGVRNQIYDVMLKLLRFALKDAWWIYTDRDWITSRLPFMSDMARGFNNEKMNISELKAALTKVGTVSGQHVVLGLDLFRDIDRVFDLKHAEYDMWQQLEGDVNGGLEQNGEFLMFERVVNDRQHSWVDVLTVVLVNIAYSVLFETFVRQLDMVNTKSSIPAVLSRLEMLSNLVELLHETDVGYTAWAVDLLGPRADSKLLQAFRLHGDSLIKGDNSSQALPLKRLRWGDGILVYTGTLQKITCMFHRLTSNLVDCISKPAINELEKTWGSKLWWELLHSKDKLLIGPKGAVHEMVRYCSKSVRDAICADLFARIIECFARKVGDGYLDTEEIIFNALAIWDSFCGMNFPSSNGQNDNYHINKLFEMVEKIKMGMHVDPLEPLQCLRDFWPPFLAYHPELDGNAKYPPLDLSYYILQDISGTVSPNNIVWIDGLMRRRLALFGNVMLIFSDDSSLQPVGMVDLEHVTAIYAKSGTSRQTVRLDASESDMDLYSCGTTDTEVQPDECMRGAPYLPENKMDRSNLYWGWRLRIEIANIFTRGQYGTLVGLDSSFDAIDLEFLGPEHRERWSRSLKAIIIPSLDMPKLLWWPKYSAQFSEKLLSSVAM